MYEKPIMFTSVCTLAQREGWRPEDPRTHWPASLANQWVLGSVREPVRKHEMKHNQKRHLMSLFRLHMCAHMWTCTPPHTGTYAEMHYRQRHYNKKLCGICALSTNSLIQYGNCHSLQKSYSVRNREIYSFSQCQNLLIIITSKRMVVS